MKVYKDRSVEKKAYELWEKAGRPHGRDVEFWLAAEKEIASQRIRTSMWPDWDDNNFWNIISRITPFVVPPKETQDDTPPTEYDEDDYNE